MDFLYPIILVILGYALKRVHIVPREAADHLIKLVFHIFLPATLIHSLIKLPLTPSLLVLPVSGFLVALLCYLSGFLIKDYLNMNRKTRGSFLIACGAMNQGLFTYPFFIMYLGDEGLSYVAFYDVGQAILALTLGYYIAIKFGNASVDYRRLMKKMLAFPVLWAFSFALLINSLSLTSIIQPIHPLIEMLHNCTVPLIMFSLGIFMEPRIREAKAMTAVIFTRFLLAFLFAYLLVSVFNLQGLERITVLIASVAPPAMITLVYSVEEKLDTEFTAALISISIVIGLIYVPLLFTLLM